ncbi:MAG: LCP family protein [Aggregatilineales bacterium]
MLFRTGRIVLISMLMLCLSLTAVAQESTPDEARVWDGKSRYNILVMGLDRRPDEGERLTRTDMIMVVSYDPQEPRLGILRMPRDMRFAVPGTDDLQRVNSVIVLAEENQPGTGIQTMVDTVQVNLGMYIDAYILFDFDAFITLVDALDGIEINVPYQIVDNTFPDMNYRFDPLRLNPGVQTLDGYDTLRYARTRHGDNDYVRGERQLQVIDAIRDRLQNREVLQALVAAAPALLDDLDGHLYTNMRPESTVFI